MGSNASSRRVKENSTDRRGQPPGDYAMQGRRKGNSNNKSRRFKNPSSLVRRLSKRLKQGRRKKENQKADEFVDSIHNDIYLSNERQIKDNRRASSISNCGSTQEAIAVLTKTTPQPSPYVAVCQRQHRRRKSINQSSNEQSQTNVNINETSVMRPRNYNGDQFYLNERTVSTSYLYGEYEVKNQKQIIDDNNDFFNNNVGSRSGKAFMSCRVSGDHWNHRSNHGNPPNNEHNNNNGYYGNKGYDTVSCAETRCSRKRKSIIRRSTNQLNPVETYVLGDGVLQKKFFSQQKLDQLRKSQVFHIMQGITMDDICGNLPLLPSRDSGFDEHSFTEDNLNASPAPLSLPSSRLSTSPAQSTGASTPPHQPSPPLSSPLSSPTPYQQKLEAEQAYTKLTCANRGFIVTSSSTDWNDAEQFAIETASLVVNRKHFVPIYIDAIGCQTCCSLRNRLLRVLGLRFRVTDATFDTIIFSWINSHRQSLLFVIVNLAIDDRETADFLGNLNTKIENSLVLVSTPCSFPEASSTVTTCLRPVDCLREVKSRLPDLPDSGHHMFTDRCRGDPRAIDLAVRAMTLTSADVGQVYEAFTQDADVGDYTHQEGYSGGGCVREHWGGGDSSPNEEIYNSDNADYINVGHCGDYNSDGRRVPTARKPGATVDATYHTTPLQTCERFFDLTEVLQILSLFSGLFSVQELQEVCNAYAVDDFNTDTMLILIQLNIVQEVMSYSCEQRNTPTQYRVNTYIRCQITCELERIIFVDHLINKVLECSQMFYTEKWLEALDMYNRICDDFEHLFDVDNDCEKRINCFSTENHAQFLSQVLSRDRYEILGEQFTSKAKRICWISYIIAHTKFIFDKHKKYYRPITGIDRQQIINNLETFCVKVSCSEISLKAWAMGIQAQLVLSAVDKRIPLSDQSQKTKDRYEYTLSRLDQCVTLYSKCLGCNASRTILTREAYGTALMYASYNQRSRHLFNTVDQMTQKTIGMKHPLLITGYELRSRLWTTEKLYGRSVECAKKAVQIARSRYGDHPVTQEMLTLLVECILERGQLAKTLSAATESLRLARAFSFPVEGQSVTSKTVAVASERLALALLRSGQCLDSIGYAQESLEISKRIGDQRLIQTAELTYKEAVKRENEQSTGFVQLQMKSATNLSSQKVPPMIRNHNTDWN